MAKAKILSANEMYKRSAEAFEMLKEVPEESRSQFLKDYQAIQGDLSDTLLFGKVEACTLLADLDKHILKSNHSEYNYKLFLLIGHKLKNQECTQKLSTLQNINEAEKEAAVWAGFIQINQNKKRPNEEITAKDIADVCVRLKYALLDNKIKLDTFKEHFKIFANDTATPETHTVLEYPSDFASHHDKGIENHKVKPMGQDDKHSHCDIL
nr:hypothetical protein [Rickettsia endosymbiont of Ceutorhynchus assimilis]